MEVAARTKLNATVKSCIENGKLNRQKLMTLLKDEDFDDKNYPNDPRSRTRNYFNPECLLILINLPTVEEARLKKLEGFLFKKAFDQVPYSKPLSIHSPVDSESSLSRGIMFVQLAKADDIHLYKEKLNDFRLDKTHRLKLFTYKEYTLTQNMSEQFDFHSAEKPPLSPVEYNKWLLNNPISEHFCIVPVVNKKVEKIIMNRVETCFDQNEPTELDVPAKRVYWSPHGTFVALTSDGGVCIGVITTDDKFQLTCAIKIIDVSHIVFSPNEKFLALCSDKPTRDNVYIVDSACGTVLWRGPVTFSPSTLQLDLHWTADSKFLVVGKSNSYRILCVTDDFKAHPKNPLNIPNLKSIKVSSNSSCVAYWITTSDNQNGIAMLYNIGNDSMHKLKQLVSPVSLEFYFQDKSKYLCITHERVIRKKSFFNVDIVFLREKDFPVLSLELPSLVSSFSWEPNGDVFILCLNDKYSFYRIVDNQIKPIVTCTLQPRMDTLWSPNGTLVVLHSINSSREYKEMRIFDSHTGTQLNLNQFRNVNKISWDSNGRYFATCATSCSFRDSGYTIWTPVGNFVRSQNISNVSDFLWRPRPPCMLSESEIQHIVKNIKKFSTEFDRAERERSKKFHMEKRKHYVSKIVNFYNILMKHTGYVKSYNEYVSSCV